MTTIRVGVIGAGGMGTRHALNLHRYVAGAHVAAIYDLDGARANEVAAACGGAAVLDDPIHLIEDGEVDAVIIAAPDTTHATFTHACLSMEKPVLCEKPLATSAADALGIVEAEQAVGRQLVGVGLMRRFDPQHLAVQQAVAAGQIGRALMFKGVHRNAHCPPHLPGEVVITNSAVHDIDAARWLLAQEVENVYVRGVRTRASFSDETRDLLLMQMELSNGCLATVEVFVAAEYGYEVSAEIVGERGTAVTLQPDQALVRAHGARGVAVPADWLTRFQEAYVAELRAWVQGIRTEQAFGGANAWDGYMSLLVSDACAQSLRSGASVAVPVPTKPRLYQ